MSSARWRCDHDKGVLLANFARRGWTRASDEDWNLYWASPQGAKAIFSAESGVRLNDTQVVSHFPNHYELTRKDLMVKNLKRYRKELERTWLEREGASNGGSTSGGLSGGGVAEAAARLCGLCSGSSGSSASASCSSTAVGVGGVGSGAAPCTSEHLDFVPTTFILPNDFSLFVEEYKKSPSLMWIMKPTSKSQGKGIFIINKLAQVKKWANAQLNRAQRDAYVISRYINDPLLIGGKKFDLRIYVLVTSYRPLKVFVYRHGFARFTTVNYSSEAHDIDNIEMHLTNVAIQKHSEGYSHSHGGKWSLKNLKLYVEGTRGTEPATKLMADIGWLIVHSLKAVQNVLINDRHCFECYGYDVMIDQALKPWLLEVNASPSLSTTTPTDKALKTALIGDVLDIVLPHNFFEQGGNAPSNGPIRPSSAAPAGANARRRSTATDATGGEDDGERAHGSNGDGGSGAFELLYDEAVEIDAERSRRESAGDSTRGRGGTGKGPASRIGSASRAGRTTWG
jgi:tubulin polyglutamylase TTLL1